MLNWVLEENSLQEFSKIESERAPLAPQRVDMMKLIKTTLPSCEALIGKRILKVKLSPVSELSADPDRIGEVLGALVRNATKLTEETGTITVGLKEEDGNVVVSVQDDGREIPEKELSRVLRLSGEGKKKDRRTGGTTELGLCKEIVELHKGSIFFYSEEGKGNQVTFTLPVQPSAKAGNKNDSK